MRPPEAGQALHQALIQECIFRLCRESPERIYKCLDMLSEIDVWQRTETTVSIGHLMLHLAGNVEQWIVGGLGGEKVTRNRDAEFTAGGRSKAELQGRLSSVLDRAGKVILGLDADALLKHYTIQDFDVDGVGVLVHVTEHFSYHTGQITFMTKSRKNKLTDYYDEGSRSLNRG